MKVIATWISVQLLLTAHCPIVWLELSLIWEQEGERDRETRGEKANEKEKERSAGKHKKASLWQPEH